MERLITTEMTEVQKGTVVRDHLEVGIITIQMAGIKDTVLKIVSDTRHIMARMEV